MELSDHDMCHGLILDASLNITHHFFSNIDIHRH